MDSSWPQFADEFLESVSRAFERRRKALAHQGRLHVESGFLGDAVESLAISLEVHPFRLIVLHLMAENRASLYVQSMKSRERGRVLLRREDMRLVNSPRRIVDAFEASVSEVRGDAADPDSFASAIAALWTEVSLRVH